MTTKAKKLLKRIGNSEEASIRLHRSDVKAADELKVAGLVEYIPISTGGANVCLTKEGLEAFELASYL